MQIRGSTQIIDSSITTNKLAATVLAPYFKADGTVAATAAFNLGGFKLTSVGTPTVGTDAANKQYVDNALFGLSFKGTVRVLIAGNVALTGIPAPASSDNITLVAGNLVLLTGQTTSAQNGLWTVSATAWTRPNNYGAASVQTNDSFVFVSEGTQYADTGWVSTTDGTITVDTTSTAWTQSTAAGTILATGVLSKTGNTISLSFGDGLENNAGTLRVALNGTTLDRSATGLRLAPIASGQLYIGQGVGSNLNAVALSGDVTLDNLGVVTVGGTVVKAVKDLNNQTPVGTVDGTNAVFTLANFYQNTVMVYQNGLLLEPGAGNDYVVSGTNAATTLTFVTAPSSGDKIRFRGVSL